MTSPLLKLLAITSLLCSLSPVIANPAPNAHGLGIVNHARHNALAAKHRRDAGKCQIRPTSASHPTPSTHSSTKPTATATATPKPSAASAPKVVNTNPGNPPNQNSNNNSPGTPGKNGGSGKKGLAWAAGGTDALFQNFNLNQISGMYTWTASCPPQASKVHYPCYPMLWGGSSDKIQAFDTVAARLDSEYYMGFNECNEPGQCGMSPGQAIPVWRSHLAPLKKNHGKKLVCPVTSSNPNGFDWVSQFFDQCPDCECDVIALHFYDTTADKFKAYVTKWHNKWPNLPIWITEFNCVNFNNDGKPQPSYGEVKAFFQEVVAWMEQPAQSYIQKYFAFGLTNPPGGGLASYTALVDTNLEPNELGRIFLGM